jgi:hypothetical protein
VAVIQVLSVALPKEPPDKLRGCSIDVPTAGSGSDVFVLRIRGWVLGRSSRAVRLEVLYEDRVIREVPIRAARPDVALSHPEIPEAKDCGYITLVGVVGFTPEFELRLRAVLEDQSRVNVGSITARREPVGSSFEPRLQPIMLTSLGRTGTTKLMGALAGHPQIVVYPHYPHECSTAKYWAHLLKVLSEPANPLQSSEPERFDTNLWFVGHNPYHNPRTTAEPELGEWFGRTYVEQLASFCQKSMDDWYMTLARNQGQDEPAYFAEKHGPTHTPVLLKELYPAAREVFLVRDFRDMLCSIMAFNKKRGFAAFGRSLADSDEEYVRQLGRRALRLHDSWKARLHRSHLVRYEDMVMRPNETLTDLLDYLDLEASDEILEGMLRRSSEETPDLEMHRTSNDLESSIGRWRQELKPPLLNVCEEAFGDILGAFGYLAGAGNGHQ